MGGEPHMTNATSPRWVAIPKWRAGSSGTRQVGEGATSPLTRRVQGPGGSDEPVGEEATSPLSGGGSDEPADR